MAFQAERTQIVDVALAAAFDHGNDVIGVPQALSRPGFQAPIGKRPLAAFPGQAAHAVELGDAVDAAEGAYAPVAFEHMLAQVTRIGAKFPFVYAEIRAKGSAPGGHF